MKKIDLGQTIQMLANIGVLAGIALLAVELRQNNQLLREQAIGSVLDTRMFRNEAVLLHEDVAALAVKSSQGEQLSPVEVARIRAGNERIIQGYQRDYLLYEAGIMPESLLRENLPRMKRSCTPRYEHDVYSIWREDWYEYAGRGFSRPHRAMRDQRL